LGTAYSNLAADSGSPDERFIATQYVLRPRAPSDWSKPPIVDEVEPDTGFQQELALIFGRSPSVRAAMPRHSNYTDLDVGYASIQKSGAWIPRGSEIVRPSMLCPFEIYGTTLELGHIKGYVEWVARMRLENDKALRLKAVSEIEAEVARAAWLFVKEFKDTLERHASPKKTPQGNMFDGIVCSYALPQVKRRLENRFAII